MSSVARRLYADALRVGDHVQAHERPALSDESMPAMTDLSYLHGLVVKRLCPDGEAIIIEYECGARQVLGRAVLVDVYRHTEGTDMHDMTSEEFYAHQYEEPPDGPPPDDIPQPDDTLFEVHDFHGTRCRVIRSPGNPGAPLYLHLTAEDGESVSIELAHELQSRLASVILEDHAHRQYGTSRLARQVNDVVRYVLLPELFERDHDPDPVEPF